MSNPVMIFKDGGPAMYLLLLLAMGLPVTLLVPLVLGSLKLRAPAAIWFGFAQLPLFVGLLGAWMGMGLALEVVQMASPEVVAPMMANGIAIAQYPLMTGSLLSALLFAAFGCSIGLGALIGVGGTRRFTLLGAIGSVLVALVGITTVIGGSFVGPVVGMLVALGLCLVSLQASDDADHNARLVAARATVGFFGTTAFLLVMAQTTTLAWADGYLAVAVASAEMKQQLLAQAYSGLWLRNGLLAAAAGVTGVATLLAAAPLFSHLLTGRTAISAVMMGLAGLPAVVLFALYGVRLGASMELAADPSDAIRAELTEQGITLPTFTEELQTPVLRGTTLAFGPSDVRLDGAVVSPQSFRAPEGPENRFTDEPQRGDLWIQASGSTKLAEIRPFAPELAKADVHWMVQAGTALRRFDLTPRASLEAPLQEGVPERFRGGSGPVYLLTKDGAYWSVAELDAGVVSRGGEGTDLEGLLERAALSATGEREVHVWLADSSTVQELMDVGSILQVLSGEDDRYEASEPDLTLVWRLDPKPDLEAEPDLEAKTQPELQPAPVAGGGLGAPSPAPPRAQAGPITIDGSLDKSLIQAVIRRHLNQIRYCYQRELTKNPNLEGALTVSFTVAPDGSVSTAVITGSSLENGAVEQCITGRFLRMKFPEPAGGGSVQVNYPFAFTP